MNKRTPDASGWWQNQFWVLCNGTMHWYETALNAAQDFYLYIPTT